MPYPFARWPRAARIDAWLPAPAPLARVNGSSSLTGWRLKQMPSREW